MSVLTVPPKCTLCSSRAFWRFLDEINAGWKCMNCEPLKHGETRSIQIIHNTARLHSKRTKGYERD